MEKWGGSKVNLADIQGVFGALVKYYESEERRQGTTDMPVAAGIYLGRSHRLVGGM